jgi:hypothetical protein
MQQRQGARGSTQAYVAWPPAAQPRGRHKAACVCTPRPCVRRRPTSIMFLISTYIQYTLNVQTLTSNVHHLLSLRPCTQRRFVPKAKQACCRARRGATTGAGAACAGTAGRLSRPRGRTEAPFLRPRTDCFAALWRGAHSATVQKVCKETLRALASYVALALASFTSKSCCCCSNIFLHCSN